MDVCIAEITDEDFGLKSSKLENPKVREASRGIVIREDGKIAIFYKKNMNEYKLPGGGIEKEETPEEAFKREILEETGCDVEIVKKLGYTQEIKSKKNFKQTSFVFVGKVIKDNGRLSLTDKEKSEGGELVWLKLKKALRLIEKCFKKLKPSPYDIDESLYSTKFVVYRDRKILEYYIKNMNK